MINFKPEALKIMTEAQKERIVRLTEGNPVDHINVHVQFDLPKGYIGVVTYYQDGHMIVGGIDREGVMST